MNWDTLPSDLIVRGGSGGGGVLPLVLPSGLGCLFPMLFRGNFSPKSCLIIFYVIRIHDAFDARSVTTRYVAVASSCGERK